MDVLPLHFRVLHLCGVWRDSSGRAYEYAWQAAVTLSIVAFTCLQAGALLANQLDAAEASQCLFMCLTYLHMTLKLVNLAARRRCLDELLGLFRLETCRARDSEEAELMVDYRRAIDRILIGYLALVLSTSAAYSLAPLADLGSGKNMSYPWAVYEFRERSDRVYFVGNYAFQVAVLLVGTFVNVTLDAMLPGFALLACAQIDLCCRRLMSGAPGEMMLRECVDHHLIVRAAVARMSEYFMMTVLPLLLVSLFAICTRIYDLARCETINAEAIPYILSFGGMSAEVFLYCWYGNELKWKSGAISQTIYEMDWTTFKPADRRQFYFVMLACERDLEISFDGFCAVTIDIFVWVMKTSYAAYNLLQSVSQK